MSERAKDILKGHRRRIVGIVCEAVLPVDFNNFQIPMIWPTVMYLFRYGRRRGKGKWEETYAIPGASKESARRKGAGRAPTPRQVAGEFLKLQGESLLGFDQQAGEDILADWLASGVLDTVRSSGDPDDPVLRVRPLHALSSWIDLPKAVSHLRGIPEFLVSTLAGAKLEGGVGGSSPFAVKCQPEENLLYRVFGHGLRIPNLNDRQQDYYDDQVNLDPDVLLCVRLAQTMKHAPPEQKGDSAKLPSFQPVNAGQLRRLREDFSVLLRGYGYSAPPSVLADFLGAMTAANFTPFLLGHARAVLNLYERRTLEKPVPSDAGIFLDCTGGRFQMVRDAAERSFLGHVELLHRYIRAHLGLRWLEKLLNDHGRTLKVAREDVPDRCTDTLNYLKFLADLRDSPRLQTIAETRLSELKDAYVSANEEMDETVRGLLDEELEPDAEPFDRWVSVLLALQQDLAERLVAQFYPGLTGGNTSFGLLRLGSRREIHRYTLSDTMLEALVHTLCLRRKTPLQSHKPSIRDFLSALQEHYGIYIQELPPQIDPYGGPASLREANLSALKDRLRMLGLFEAVSDAEAMQRVHGRYPVKLEIDRNQTP